MRPHPHVFGYAVKPLHPIPQGRRYTNRESPVRARDHLTEWSASRTRIEHYSRADRTPKLRRLHFEHDAG